MRTVLRTCIPGLIVLLAGAWRDSKGLTRPLILFVLCGEILATVTMLVGVFYWSSSSWIFASIESVIAGFAGGQPLLSMANNCHIAENSSVESRTTRFAYMVGTVLIGGILSNAIGGHILSALGYKYFFVLIIGFDVICICLAFAFIKDNPAKKRTSRSLLKISTLKCIFTSKENVSGIWMTIVASCSINAAIHGEFSMFLYYMEEGFEYSVTEAGYVFSYRMAVEAVVSTILSPILSNVFKMNDFKVIILGAVVTFISSMALTFAMTIEEICIFTFLGIFKPIVVSALRSILSKFVKPEETGIYFGFESVFSTFLPSILLPLYDKTFSATVDFLPGGYFLVSAALEFVVTILACIIFWIYGRKKMCEAYKQDVVKFTQKCRVIEGSETG